MSPPLLIGVIIFSLSGLALMAFLHWILGALDDGWIVKQLAKRRKRRSGKENL